MLAVLRSSSVPPDPEAALAEERRVLREPEAAQAAAAAAAVALAGAGAVEAKARADQLLLKPAEPVAREQGLELAGVRVERRLEAYLRARVLAAAKAGPGPGLYRRAAARVADRVARLPEALLRVLVLQAVKVEKPVPGQEESIQVRQGQPVTTAVGAI